MHDWLAGCARRGVELWVEFNFKWLIANEIDRFSVFVGENILKIGI